MQNTLNLTPKVPSSYRLNIVHMFKVSSKFPGNLIGVSSYKYKTSNVLSAYDGTEQTVIFQRREGWGIVRSDSPNNSETRWEYQIPQLNI